MKIRKPSIMASIRQEVGFGPRFLFLVCFRLLDPFAARDSQIALHHFLGLAFGAKVDEALVITANR